MPADNKNAVTDEDFKSAVFEDGGNLVVNLSGIQEAKYEAIPRGIYNGEVDTVEYGMSNNSGAPMFTLSISITEGEYQGRKLYTYWSFSQKALPFTKASMQRIAPDLLTVAFNPQKVADEGTLLGRACRIRVTVEDYQGESRSRIAQVLSPAGDNATSGGNGTGAAKKSGFF